MIRAGRDSVFINDFIEHSIVAIGWHRLGNFDTHMSKDQLTILAKDTWPDFNKSKISSAVGQVFRFLNEIKIGDRVVSYDSGQRKYHIGSIQSEAVYSETVISEMPRLRDVTWQGEVDRDSLSVSTRNSLGAISTLFLLPESAAQEIEDRLAGKVAPNDIDTGEEFSDQDQLQSIRDQSRELIKDKINRLDPYELQDLVAGVLRAMGYKTRVSPPGADRGIDILASPDGFGFEQPRIVVECKHRRDAMGSQEIRSFLGGRHKDDKGLYVSTGGFTKDARYEAERANIPVTLMDLDQLVEAVIDNYESMDVEVKTLLPLVKLYWPA